ncbi:hypothetical protein MBLNU459_g3543t1 [Dothideomycetes sp. NU459]
MPGDADLSTVSVLSPPLPVLLVGKDLRARYSLLSKDTGVDSAKVAAHSATSPLIESQRPAVTPPQAASEPASKSEVARKRKVLEPEDAKVEPQQHAKKPRKEERHNEQAQQKDEQPVQSPCSQQTSLGSKKAFASATLSLKSLASGSELPKTWPSQVGKQKVKGLSNPGQWCYRRSVLQNLLAVPQFFNLLEQNHAKCNARPGRCVTCALRRLSHTYHTSGPVNRDLKALDDAIKLTGKSSDPRWRAAGQTQEDSHEFLQYLLGTIEGARGMPKKQFDALFRISHKISWTCSSCGKDHIRTDPPGLSLNLPIPRQQGPAPLSSCLDAYHKESNVTIRCEKCKKNLKRTRTFRIDSSPEVLTIQLMRFGFGARGPTKNKDHVDYPETLDLSRWAVNGSAPLRYRLQAVVAHSGSLKFGHYIACVSGADGVKEISDSDVQSVSASALRKPTGGFNPYILVYIKE